jgi:molybdopterin-guanine dinucleotide biosynthesis protein A
MKLVILAGGRASRLGGGDKGLRVLGGATVLSRILARLGAEQVAINANGDPARFDEFGLPVLPDPVEGLPGPLAGVLAAMVWAGEGHVATVPGDAPFLPRDLLPRLAEAREASGAEIAVATSNGRVHPVVALWPARLAEDLRNTLVEEGLRKVESFLDRYQTIRVDFTREPVDPFFNVNRPEDLAEAEGLCLLYPML